MKTLIWSYNFFFLYFFGFPQLSLQAQSAPVIADIEDYEATYNSAAIEYNTDTGEGTAYHIFSKFRTAPTKSQIIAGQNKKGVSAVWSASQSVTVTGQQSITATGLPENTQLYSHVVHVDASGNQSNILTGNSIVTPIVTYKPGSIDTLATNYDPTATISDNSETYSDIDCSVCTVVIETSDASLVDASTLGVSPGDTICFRNGTHGARLLTGFIGTEDAPYYFTNCDGQAILSYTGGGEVLEFTNSEYVRITGTGHTSTHQYGIKLTGFAHSFRSNLGVSDIQLDNVEITGGKIGVWMVNRPDCDENYNRGTWITYNHFVHHNYIHDQEGEGTYIGGSKWNSSFSNSSCSGTPLYQADLVHVRVYNNLIDGAGWDGLQVGGGIENTWIYNNTVKNYGLLNNGAHQIGIIVNPGTTGQIFANTIDDGTGPGIQVLGFDQLVYSNLIIDPGFDGVLLGDRSPLSGKTNRIINNTIVNAGDYGIDNNASESNNILENNLILGSANSGLNTGNASTSNNIILSSIVTDDYVNVANNDYSPVAGTDPIDSGKTFSFQADSLIIDRNSTARTLAGRVDVGAFEFGEDLVDSTNAAPTISDATIEIDENASAATSVGIVTASDPDGDTLTFSIVSGNDLGAFEIDQSSGEISVADAGPLDYETNPTFSLTIEVSDGELTDAGIITVDLNDLDESTNAAPSVSNTTFSIDENASAATSVGIVTASDPDGDTLTFSIVSGNELGAFEIDQSSGVISVADAGPLDYETNPTFSLTVAVSDGELTDTGIITLDLNDLDESTNAAPSVSNTTFSIDENASVATSVGIVTASDPDGDTLTFSIVSGNDLGAFEIDQSSGEISVADAGPLDYETNPTFSLTVAVSDGELTDTGIITLDLNDLADSTNAAPSVSNSTFEIDENASVATSVGIVTASDTDGDTLTFSIVSGNDLGAFQINQNSGEVTVADAEPLDFETNPSFSLAVEVSDGELADVGIMTVNLNDLADSTNAAPSVSNSTFEIDENASVATSVGIVTASDTDGDTLTFSIVSGNDLGAFQINQNSGEVTVADAEPLDFETNPSFSLAVEVSDGELADVGIMTVNLNDLADSTNAAPSISNTTFEIDENASVETFVGIVNASDPDGDELTFSIVSENNLGAFKIDQSSGIILVADTGPMDYETNPSFSLAVEVSDGELTDVGMITVNINDLEESTNAAPSVSNATFDIDENPSVETTVGTVNASDPDGDELIFSIISGNDLGAFQINQNSGEVTVADAEPLDFETPQTFNLEVEASDGELKDLASIVINLKTSEFVLGISDEEENNIKLFPNPARDFINIEWSSFEQAIITDLTGRQLIESKNRTLLLKTLPSGVYLINLSGNNDEIIRIRFIKE